VSKQQQKRAQHQNADEQADAQHKQAVFVQGGVVEHIDALAVFLAHAHMIFDTIAVPLAIAYREVDNFCRQSLRMHAQRSMEKAQMIRQQQRPVQIGLRQNAVARGVDDFVDQFFFSFFGGDQRSRGERNHGHKGQQTKGERKTPAQATTHRFAPYRSDGSRDHARFAADSGHRAE